MPSRRQYSWAYWVSTERPSSSRSSLLPTTMNGKVSGIDTIDFWRKEFFQFGMLSKDQLLVMS